MFIIQCFTVVSQIYASIWINWIVCLLLNQAECDELAQRAEALKEENANLRSEVNRIKSDYEQLLAENASLKVMFSSWFDLFNFIPFFVFVFHFTGHHPPILHWTYNEELITDLRFSMINSWLFGSLWVTHPGELSWERADPVVGERN